MLNHLVKQFLLWCANEHIEFRFPELRALASVHKIKVTWIDVPKEDPYVIIAVDSEEDARQLISRSVLVQSCYELWGEGNSEEELHSAIKSQPNEFLQSHFAKDKTFKVTIDTFNKTLTKSQKLDKIESFSYLPIEGRVNLTTPDTNLQLIEYYGLSANSVPKKPYKLFFGRWLADGGRAKIQEYTLKKRNFIGSTSMDPQLSFIMSNLAQVKKSDIVVDPFVGTGSVLVAAADHGAYVWGWDISFLTLHGRTRPTRPSEKVRKPDESILNNLCQYDLSKKYLDVVVMDSSNLCWRSKGCIDAIITDPPYGIRESVKKVGPTKEDPSINEFNSEKITMKERERRRSTSPHYPATVDYSFSDIFKDLLNFASQQLVIGGRVVFWVPVFRDDYCDDMIPTHPCLHLEANMEQILNTHSSRRLITMVKLRHPEDSEVACVKVVQEEKEFRHKFFQASQQLTKKDKQAKKLKYPRDKRGQGLGFRLENHVNKISDFDSVQNGDESLDT